MLALLLIRKVQLYVAKEKKSAREEMLALDVAWIEFTSERVTVIEFNCITLIPRGYLSRSQNLHTFNSSISIYL